MDKETIIQRAKPMTHIDQLKLLTLYRFMRKEGQSFTEAVKDLSHHYFKTQDWIIKNLLEAEERKSA